jgi:transcriptional regulator with XRE-family HTH domain
MPYGQALDPPITPEELRAYRTRLGYTQAELARAIGVHPKTVAIWEQGQQRQREPTALRTLLDALARTAGPPPPRHGQKRPLRLTYVPRGARLPAQRGEARERPTQPTDRDDAERA